MTEYVGHTAIVESSLDGSTWVEVDGDRSFGVSRARDLVETTTFADATGSKTRIAALRTGSCDLGGDIVFAVSTLTLDLGIAKIVQRLRDAGALYLRTKLDGAGGTYRGAVGLVEEFELKADVGGAVEWTAKTCLNGAGWA